MNNPVSLFIRNFHTFILRTVPQAHHQIMIQRSDKSYGKLPLPSVHISKLIGSIFKNLHNPVIIYLNPSLSLPE